ncbi:hypothetical protein CTA1_9273 [Colletotrichum tanaceti]|uniref:Uncharacterized protein n=1 Tax=Colletotrichum tanaceti TaxID=1306861 RepID=A0A4U6X3A1_9PEZI|nr:hypothetical protein CTA1_9273 [Colletotrichum tanaceti]
MFSDLASLESKARVTIRKTTTETEVASSTRQTTTTEVPRRAKQGIDVDNAEAAGSVSTRRTTESWTLESSVPLWLLLNNSLYVCIFQASSSYDDNNALCRPCDETKGDDMEDL